MISLYRTLTHLLPCLVLAPHQSSQRSCLDIFHHKHQYYILWWLVVHVPGLFKSLKLCNDFRKAAAHYRWKFQSLPYYQSGQWCTAGEVSRWSASHEETVLAGGQQNPSSRYLVSNFLWQNEQRCLGFASPPVTLTFINILKKDVVLMRLRSETGACVSNSYLRNMTLVSWGICSFRISRFFFSRNGCQTVSSDCLFIGPSPFPLVIGINACWLSSFNSSS